MFAFLMNRLYVMNLLRIYSNLSVRKAEISPQLSIQATVAKKDPLASPHLSASLGH
jgi:hypothetical protein